MIFDISVAYELYKLAKVFIEADSAEEAKKMVEARIANETIEFDEGIGSTQIVACFEVE